MDEFTSALFHKEIRTVELTAANGDRLLRRRGTIAWLFNNPGNLRPSTKYKDVIGEAQTKSGNFAIFSIEASERAEKRALLKRKCDSMPLRSAIFMSESQFHAMIGAMGNYEGFNEYVTTVTLSDRT